MQQSRQCGGNAAERLLVGQADRDLRPTLLIDFGHAGKLLGYLVDLRRVGFRCGVALQQLTGQRQGGADQLAGRRGDALAPLANRFGLGLDPPLLAFVDRRDYEDNRIDYAKAGIAEYWIVDPQQHRITVLVLAGDSYREHGVYTAGQIASGQLLPALQVDVDAVMNA